MAVNIQYISGVLTPYFRQFPESKRAEAVDLGPMGCEIFGYFLLQALPCG